MTKAEIKQKFFDVIGTKLSYSAKTDEIKDLSKAFKFVCDIDHDDNFMEQLAEMPKASKNGTIQPILQVDDDGGFGLCD